jgi:hypothetical protein
MNQASALLTNLNTKEHPMKRRYILPVLTILMTPLALSTGPLLASGGDSHEDETESTEVPQSSLPRRDRPRSSVPSTSVIPTTVVGVIPANSVPPASPRPPKLTMTMTTTPKVQIRPHQRQPNRNDATRIVHQPLQFRLMRL